jgi:hypothetical protein
VQAKYLSGLGLTGEALWGTGPIAPFCDRPRDLMRLLVMPTSVDDCVAKLSGKLVMPDPPAAWDRSRCRQSPCTCHDATAPPYECSGCGCRAAGPVAVPA